jgi:hypothetical protein
MKRIFMAIAATSLAALIFAGPGGIPFESLDSGTGIRELSMGGAATANCPDASAVFWNPAYLDTVSRNEVSMSIETLFGGANFDQISFASPAGIYGGIGASLSILNYPAYDKQDAAGLSLGDGSMKDIAASLGYGKTLFWGIQAGLAAKMIVKNIDDATYTGFNADAALFKAINDTFDIGMVFKNVLPLSVKYYYEEEKFVSSARLGAAIKILDRRLKIALDLEKTFIDTPVAVYGGAEYNISNIFYIRAGAGTDGEFTGGAGIAWQDIMFDYCAGFNELTVSHKFALSYRFGGYELSLKAEPDIFSPISGNKKTYIRVTAKTKYQVYKWKLEITDNKGDVIKSWMGAGDPDAEEVWDGLKSDGMPMDEGEYRAKLTVIDENDIGVSSDPIKIKISANTQYNIPMMGD